MNRITRLIMVLCVSLPVQAVAQGWVALTNKMSDSRWAPSAAVLPGGKRALIVGGFSYDTGSCTSSADLFVEGRDKFKHSRSRLTYPRDFATANTLFNGSVLIAGGYNTILGSLNTAELYDAHRDMFRVIFSQMASPRELFTSTLLADGRVLLVGGFNTHRGHTLASADIYNPRMETFTPTNGSMSVDRFGQAAARLTDGRILIVGGTRWHVGHESTPLASAEIFDPATGLFRRTMGDMSVPRDRPTATLLADGTVLVAGGQNGKDGPRVAELYDPRTDRFTAIAPLVTPRMAASDLALPDSSVLLVGGWSPPSAATTSTTELFDFSTHSFRAGPAMPSGAHDLALLLFSDGLVLTAGGKQVTQGHESSLATGAVWQGPRS